MACTHNGGPSGPLYGRWILKNIEAEGMEAPAQTGQIYWSFQHGVIEMQRDNGNFSVSTRYGNFRLDDNTLFLDFPEEHEEPVFPETGLALENRLQVLKLTGKEMVLLYQPRQDASLTYYFRKW